MFKPPITNSAIIVSRAVGTAIASTSDAKITYLPAKPASGGRPIRLNRISEKQTTTPGERRTRPAVVGDLFAAQLVAQEGDDGEGAQVHEQIHADVERNCGQGSFGRGRCFARPAPAPRPPASSCNRHARSWNRPAAA